MWAMSVVIYFTLKYITLDMSPVKAHLPYFLGWPGMNFKSFHADKPQPISWQECGFALFKLSLGVIFLKISSQIGNPLLEGWAGMVGLIFVLHFGLFHLLSLFWRAVGFNAKPIMNWPVLANSLSDFWGKRWNLAFNDFVHQHIFRPTVRTCGVFGSTMLVFFASGLVHDLVISVPVNSGYGGPTLYFVLQGLGLIVERKWIPKRLRRAFCAAILLLPLPLLFHQAFVLNVVVPTVRALTWTL